MSSWFSITACLSSSTPSPSTTDHNSTPPDDPLPPDSSEFATSLDTHPRWLLSARAYALRSAASLAFSCISPYPTVTPQRTSTLYFDSTLGYDTGPQAIPVDTWLPIDDYDEPSTSTKTTVPLRPAIINFHGGGFVIGSGTDDRIWTSHAQQELDALVFSVNYRLAPSYPFPKAVEDCVDAILHISARAESLGIDPSAIFLSGFSAGGSLALAAWIVLQSPERWGYDIPKDQRPDIRGLLLFYPGLDWSVSRSVKRSGCQRPELALPVGMTDLFDCSYIFPKLARESRRDWRLSPGLMDDEMVKKLPPVHFCVCEHDMLLAEQEMFVQRMAEQGKPVNWRVVGGEKHAWDKPMPVTPKDSVLVEYEAAIRELKGWLGRDKSDSPNSRKCSSAVGRPETAPGVPVVMQRSVSGSSMER